VSVLEAGNSTSRLVDRGIDFDAVYDEHIALMIGVAVDRFHIAETDAQALAHEIFLAYFLKAEEIRDVRAWLLGGICNASRDFLKKRKRDVSLAPEMLNRADPRQTRAAEALPDQIAAKEAFACVTPRCQLALRLRYLEGYSIQEIATELKTTPKYAQNLVSRCLQMARDRCGIKREDD
jgi:RNA polymerase sigma factor (sigma-70 family)